MRLALSKYPLSSIIAIFIVLISWCYLIISIMLYPGSFSPFTNYISDLGRYGKNPQGAIIYNIGVIIIGCLFLVFFLGLNIFCPAENPGKYFLRLNQFFGAMSVIAIFLVAIYTEDYMDAHIFWSAVMFVLLTLCNILSGLFLITQKDSVKIVSYYNFFAAGFGVLMIFILIPEFIILEWINTLVGHINLILLAYNYKIMLEKRSELI